MHVSHIYKPVMPADRRRNGRREARSEPWWIGNQRADSAADMLAPARDSLQIEHYRRADVACTGCLASDLSAKGCSFGMGSYTAWRPRSPISRSRAALV